MMKKVKLALSALYLSLVIMIVAGCSSGGGSGGISSNASPSIDRTPDAFSFVSQDVVPLNTVITSHVITVSGLSAAATTTINVSAGSAYAINGGPYVTEAGTVVNGDRVALRHTSAATPATATVTTLTIGGVSGTFTSTTTTSTLAFSFTSQAGVPLGTLITSDPIDISGLAVPEVISVSAGSSYSIDALPFVTGPGLVNNGSTVRVQHTSSLVAATATVTTLKIGVVEGTFTSTTAPFAFSFITQAGVEPNTLITSETITIAGLAAPAALSISAGSAYSLNAWPFFLTGDGTVVNGDTLAVQHTSALGEGIDTVTTLTIGGVTGTFTSTTQSLAFGQAVYDANCASCHSLVPHDPVVAGDASDLAGQGNMFSPTGPPLVLVNPIDPPHPVINIDTGQIANLAYFLGTF